MCGVQMKEERTLNTSRYKRGITLHDGKACGVHPDGRRYRIYDANSRPFAQMVDVDGKTYLRVRQTTELGYVDCPVGGCCGLSYPNSTEKRGRVIDGGMITKTLARGQCLVVLVEV